MLTLTLPGPSSATGKVSRSTRTRNTAILKSYTLIVEELKLTLAKSLQDRKRPHLDIWYEYQSEHLENEVLKEFVCMFCSVTLSTLWGKYIIEFDTDADTEKNIGRVAYNAMVRVAFKHTQEENTGFKTESCLFINLDKTSQYQYFLNRQKEEDLRACLHDYEEALRQ